MTPLSQSHESREEDLFPFDDADLEGESGFDVTCPGCGHRLNDDQLFDRYRICASCARHFWMPARERLNLIVDSGSFHESNAELVSTDPLHFRDAAPRSDRASASADSSAYPFNQALLTGTAKVGGQDVVIAVVDFALLGEDIGVVAGEKLVLAIEQASSRRLPLFAAVSGGAGRSGESLLSLVQSARLANAVARLQSKGIPFVALLSHPTSGTLYAGFACHANFQFAEPGSHLGSAVQHRQRGNLNTPVETATAEHALQTGMIDGIIDRRHLREKLVTLVDILTARASPRIAAAVEAPAVSALSTTQEFALATDPTRPTGSEYVERIMPGFVELHGDRAGMECSGVRIGLGQLDGVSMGVIAIDRLRNSEDDDFVAGLRKATRLLRLASLLELPVLTLYDSLADADAVTHSNPGAAIALLFRTVTTVPVPTVTAIIGAASGMQSMWGIIADRTLMMEHAVIWQGIAEGAQSAGSNIWTAGTTRYFSARDCKRLGLVDTIIPEPGEGAHRDPAGSAQQLRLTVSHAFGELAGIGPRRLQDERSRKLRSLALASPAGSEEIKLEIAHLHDLQRSVGRSIDDLRDRLETHSLGLPSRPALPQRPGMPGLPTVVLPNLPSIRRPTVRRPEIGDLAERLASTRREFAEIVSDVRSNLADSIPGSHHHSGGNDIPPD